MIEYVFGMPVFKTSLKDDVYDREYLKNTITDNYYKNKKRNKWDENDFIASNIHHSLCDNNNKTGEFESLDYETLVPVYNKHLDKWLKTLVPKKNISYSYTFANYTAMTEFQYMKSHIHSQCDFAAVHYLKFNPLFHQPTYFENENPNANFYRFIRPNIENLLDETHLSNRWFNKIATLDTEEDDMVIFPSTLPHSVAKMNKTKEIRMTIALNINIIEHNG